VMVNDNLWHFQSGIMGKILEGALLWFEVSESPWRFMTLAPCTQRTINVFLDSPALLFSTFLLLNRF